MTYTHNTIVGLLLTVVIILCVTTDTVSGDFCNEEYEVTVRTVTYSYVWRNCWYYRPCRYYYYWWYYHYYWRYWHCRYLYTCQRWRARYSYSTETRTRKVCCEGYKGTRCDIPICTECKNNGVCTAPDVCFCPAGTTGSNCELKTCGADNDCYPGNCDTSSNQCMCASGFTGQNCENMKDAGILKECSVQFQNAALEDILSGECGKDTYGRTQQHYTSVSLPRWLVANYKVSFDNIDDLPGTPSWIRDAPLGLTESYVKPYLYNTDGTNIWSGEKIKCVVALAQGEKQPSQDNPYLTMNCDNIKETWAFNVGHQYKLTLEIESTSGGFKEYLAENNVAMTMPFTGPTEREEVVDIIFDLEPPVHCKTTGTCRDENENPCEFFPDITKHGSVSLEWDGWNDTDSGLDSYSYTVYKMEKDDSGQLTEGDKYIPRTTLSVLDSMPDVSMDTPGLYSVILEVTDAVGNSAKARSLLLYDNSSVIEVIDDNPLSISGAILVGSNYWIVNPQDKLEIRWPNRYINRFLHENSYLMGAKGMQGVLDDKYGNLTTAKIPNSQGITQFGVLVTSEDNKPKEEDFSPVDVTNPYYVSSIEQKLGSVIYVNVFSKDILGNAQVENVPIGVDITKAELDDQEVYFTKNENVTVGDIPYVSSVSVQVEDAQSGIFSINYTVHDIVDDNAIIIESSQLGQQHNRHTTDVECASTGDCYCASLGGCFNDIQKIWLNNCDLEGLDGHVFQIEFSVYNGAGMETSHTYSIGKFENINGLGYHPPPHKATYVTYPDAFYKVTLTWEYLRSCYKAQTVIITYKTASATETETVQADEVTFEVDNLLPNMNYEIQMKIQYADNKQSEVVVIQFTSVGPGFTESITQKPIVPDDLGIGAIVGIVIVLIIVAVLVAAVILLVVRRKQHKPMVPPVVRDAGSRIRDRFSRVSRSSPNTSNQYYREEPETGQMYSNKAYDNNKDYSRPLKAASLGKPPPYDATFKVAYVGEDDDDIYTYGQMDTEADATWKVSNDKLVMGKALPDVKGKFADLKLATLHTDSGSKAVVAKMNKVGATDIEKLLMTAKMNFLATGVPENENLLQFIAAVPPPQGPMILMEYCSDGKLSDWLKKQKKITGDVEELMINFSIQVAAGMTHLHSAGILHRRLGARNILLTMNMSNQLVAKVTGFGPMKGEQTGTSEGKSKGDRVPFKWMAPEQFDVTPQGRIYTPTTDVWSYGILLHEIFSKGEQPYPDMTIAEVKAKVAKGYRMPKVQQCPDFVYDEIMTVTWNNSPEDRPTFDMIHKGLKSFFQGGASQEEYVYDANE